MVGRASGKTNHRDTQRRPVHPAPDVGILTIAEVAGLLRVSRSTVERFLYQNGMPYLDLGAHDSRRRAKRLLRFEREAVLAWARARAVGGDTRQ